MERKIDYINTDGSIQTSYFSGYTNMRTIKKHIEEQKAKILNVYKPIECKHCKGEGILWKKEK